MTEFERFAQALALTESDDNERAWGDPKVRHSVAPPGHVPAAHETDGSDFMACGRWQIHPAWVDEWWPDDVGVEWSWDRIFRAALLRFWGTVRPKVPHPIEVAMEFHLGEAAVKRGDWDEYYEHRFLGYWLKLGDPAKPAREE